MKENKNKNPNSSGGKDNKGNSTKPAETEQSQGNPQDGPEKGANEGEESETELTPQQTYLTDETGQDLYPHMFDKEDEAEAETDDKAEHEQGESGLLDMFGGEVPTVQEFAEFVVLLDTAIDKAIKHYKADKGTKEPWGNLLNVKTHIKRARLALGVAAQGFEKKEGGNNNLRPSVHERGEGRKWRTGSQPVTVVNTANPRFRNKLPGTVNETKQEKRAANLKIAQDREKVRLEASGFIADLANKTSADVDALSTLALKTVARHVGVEDYNEKNVETLKAEILKAVDVAKGGNK